jgi:hypothetical protein
MRRRVLLGALCLVGVLVVELLGPTVPSLPLADVIPSVSESQAAGVGRGGGGGEGSGGSVLQIGSRTATILKSIGVPLLFILTAAFLAYAAVQRSVGVAITVLILSLAVGAFLLAPDQMKQTFLSIYQYVL